MKIKIGWITLLGVLLSACSATATPEPFVEPEYFLEHLIPELVLPEGAQPLGGGGGGGPYAMGTGSYFLSELGIVDVYQHYFDQLELAGWHLISEQDSEDRKVSFWEVTDDEGAAWSGKMEVIYSPPDFPDTYLVNVMILLPQ